MNFSNLAFIFEIIYLIYMFYFFKTTFEIHHPLESSIVSISDYLKHPIHTGEYESKICLFGKQAMILLLGFLLFRFFYKVPKVFSFIILTIVLIVSLLNLNAFLYLIPYFFIELILLQNPNP